MAAGEHLIGAKLGLTSAVKRKALNIHEPVFGRLTSGMVVPHGEPVRLRELIRPRVEPEIAFLIGERIEAPTTVAAVLAATEAVLPAIEVVDSRYADPFRLPDSVADNAGAARVVLGTQARRPSDLVDLAVLGCVFRRRRGNRDGGRRRGDGTPRSGPGVAGGGAVGPWRGDRARLDRAVRRAHGVGGPRRRGVS